MLCWHAVLICWFLPTSLYAGRPEVVRVPVTETHSHEANHTCPASKYMKLERRYEEKR
jgi:hypothetical protein